MADVSHTWSDDLKLSPTGDLALASGTELGQQRVIKRLITNPLDDINHINYGAGLRAFIGSPAIESDIKAAILFNMQEEGVVAQNPPPVVKVNVYSNGVVSADVRYTDKITGQQSLLTIPISE